MRGLWIGGKAVPAASGKTFETINPATGAVLERVALGEAEDVDRAVGAAAAAQDGAWGRTTPKARARVLFEAARLIRERADPLALVESRDAGKPLASARGEILYAADVLEYYAGAATKHFGETVPVSNPGLCLVLKEPVGVCGLIVPWNFPAVIAAWKLGPALACGNAVVLKPAEDTPLSALLLAELFAEAGLPAGALNVVPGYGVGCGDALAAHPLVRKVSFTGSTATGAKVMRAAADGIRRVSLELGGKSANIVFDDCGDLDRVVEKSLWSVYDNAGQDCCARSRALVHRKVFDKYAEKFVARAKKVVVGDPMKKGVEMGPLISAKQRDRVTGYVRIGESEGAKRLCGGGAPADPSLRKGFYVEPCVLEGATPKMRVFQEEIFGPVVCLTPFKTEEEAVALANDSEFGLSGSIWTRDMGRALRMARAVKTGALSVNSASSVYLEAPFGGFKSSGLGRELGMRALEAYTETKTVFLSQE
jgi:acyl-CoA reductase-like NAD-dependent aldehyde dehydrogenase